MTLVSWTCAETIAFEGVSRRGTQFPGQLIVVYIRYQLLYTNMSHIFQGGFLIGPMQLRFLLDISFTAITACTRERNKRNQIQCAQRYISSLQHRASPSTHAVTPCAKRTRFTTKTSPSSPKVKKPVEIKEFVPVGAPQLQGISTLYNPP